MDFCFIREVRLDDRSDSTIFEGRPNHSEVIITTEAIRDSGLNNYLCFIMVYNFDYNACIGYIFLYDYLRRCAVLYIYIT